MPDLLSNQGGGVAGFITPTVIHSGSALFPSVTPRAEILTGSEAGAYNQAVVIRHDTVDSNAVTRRLGLLIKLSSEGSSGESAKHVGFLAESTATFANSTALHLVTNDIKRAQIDSSGNMSVGGVTTPLTRLHVRASGGSSGLTPVAGTTLTVENTAGDNNISLLVGTSNSQGIHFGNTTNVVDGGIVFTSTRILQLRSGNNNTRFTIDSNGNQAHTSSGDGPYVSISPTGGTRTTANTELNVSSSAIFDTTAGALISTSIVVGLSSTRSAGANNLTNRGLLLDVTGGQVNQALVADRGDVLLNSTNGTTAIATSPVSTQQLAIFGALGGWAIFARNNRTAQTVGTTISESRADGTYDTTAGTLESIGVFGNVTSTRSAGANNLNNYGGRFSASGAQVNRAIQTDSGDVILNGTSGNTMVGTFTAVAKLSVARTNGGDVGAFTFTGSSMTAQSIAVNGQSSGTFDTTAGAINCYGLVGNVTSNRSAGANNLINTAIYGNATSAQNNRALQTDNGDVYLNAISGNSGIGVGTGSTLTHKVTVQPSTAGQHAMLLQWALTGQTTGSVAAIRSSQQGTFDTTAGSLTVYSINSSATSTRSAGSNNLTNLAGLFSASGAQVNIALQTDAGDVILNSTGGLTGIGVTPVATQQLTVQSVSNSVVFKTTAADSNLVFKLQNDAQNWQIGVRGASGAPDSLIFRDESANIDILSILKGSGLGGKMTFNAITNDNGFELTQSNTGQTGTVKAIVYALNNGSYDATAADRQAIGFRSVMSATRSAGSNIVQNIAAMFDAAGGQQNIALATLSGEVVLNSVNGSTQCGPLNENGWTSLYQTSSQDVTNAQDTDSNTFTFAVTAGNTYAVDLEMFVSSNDAANDYEFRFAVSAGTMSGRGWCITLNAADAITTTALIAAAAANTSQVPVGTNGTQGVPTKVTAQFCFTHNTTSGNFKMQFGNNVAAASKTSRTIATSRMRWRQVT